jgi:hypothetical protein
MSNDPLVGLRWALKRSFLDYIARAPGGAGSLSDGAVATELKEIVFGPDLRDPPEATEGIFLAFRGTVTFTGHFGMLFVRISNPWVTIQEERGEITILDPLQEEGAARLRLSLLTVTGSRMVSNTGPRRKYGLRPKPARCSTMCIRPPNPSSHWRSLFRPLPRISIAPARREPDCSCGDVNGIRQ